MKKLFLTLTLLVAAFATFAQTATYKVDAEKSTLVWTGKKVGGEHTGNIKLGNGTVSENGSALTGNFTFDLTSITCTDITNEKSNQNLIGHLKSDDFFSVDKFPTANFEITSVKNTTGTNYDVTGNLTIKGITKEVTFPAAISKTGNVMVVVGTAKINRTNYSINYNSASIFSGIADRAIDDFFELKINLVATK